MSRSNPAFMQDEFELRQPEDIDGKYQIPRVGRSAYSRTSAPNDFPRANFKGESDFLKEDPNYKKGISYTIPIYDPHNLDDYDGDDDKPDYSLLSYLKYFECYRNFDKSFRRFSKRVNLKQKLTWIWLCIMACLFVAYFVAALLFSVKQSQKNTDYWCDGDGILIILVVIVFSGLFYFQIVKPFVVKKISSGIDDYMSTSPEMQRRHKKYNLFMNQWYVKLVIYLICLSAIVLFLAFDTVGDRDRLISAFGIFAILAVGFLFSAAPRKVVWRHVVWGMGLQFILGLLILRWDVGRSIFQCLGDKVSTFLSFTDAGSGFVFGVLVTEMQIFAFKVLSVILFFSFFVQVLYYWGAMQWIVLKLGWLLQISIGTTACESVNASANIFLGQSEAPLLIKPFLADMTKSELHAVMTGGFATIAGSVLAAYISFGVSSSHLLTASVMSAPAALAFSKLFYPETEQTKTNAKNIPVVQSTEVNVLHAALEGVTSAIPLVACIAANLIAFVAFVAFFDAIFNWSCVLIDIDDGVCSLSNICGYIFMPLAWVIGIPWSDCYYVGQLLGTKTIVNEFVAYLQLANYIEKGLLQQRSQVIATYALCGFANIGSIGIQIGALGAMAPSRRDDLARLGVRAMIAGNFACFLTACVAGTLLPSDAVLSASFGNSTLV